MDYNPHAQRYASTQRQLDTAKRERDKLQKEWDRLTQRTLLEAQEEHIRTLEASLAEMDREAGIRRAIVEMDETTAALRAGIGPAWDPRSWFSKDKAALRVRLAEHQKNREVLISEAKKREKRVVELRAHTAKLEAEIAQLERFDREAARIALAAATAAVDALLPEAHAAMTSYHLAASELSGPVGELELAQRKVRHYHSAVERATQLEKALNATSDRREKAIIHNTCRAEYDGLSSPAHVAQKMRGNLTAAERDLEKCRERVEETAARLRRDIRTVVFDGNNLCYQGDRFIGLRALRPAVGLLVGRYSVVVAFDQGIAQRLRFTAQELKRAFGENVTVHIVKGKADESILRAAASPTAFVVSRDRYAEYGDMDAVSGRRILRHEILNDRVIIPDLGVDAPFSD